MRGAGKADTAVLVTLVIILRVIYLLLISGLEVDPGEIYYFLPLISNPPR